MSLPSYRRLSATGFLAASISCAPALAKAPAPAPATAVATAAPTAQAAAPASSSDLRKSEPLGCLIEPSLVVDVGSPVIGVIDTVQIERGQFVRKGQVVAQLDARVERAAVALAIAKHQSEADVNSAKSAQDFARRRQERNESLFKKEFISSQALDQSGTEEKLAEMKLEQALDQRVLAAQEVKLARAQLALRTITSPVNGVVVERFMSSGERVEDKPIVKLAQIDPLRVDVIMPASQISKMRVGMTAKVFPDLPDAGEQTARVTIVDRVLDAASNTFRVRLDMRNPGLGLPAGLRCKVEFRG